MGHLDRATRYLERMKEELTRNPFGYGHLWLAADAALDGAAELTVVGKPRDRQAFLAVVAERFAPTLHLAVYTPGAPVPPVLETQLEQRREGAGVQAYLCRRFACLPPEQSPAGLARALGELAAPRSAS